MLKRKYKKGRKIFTLNDFETTDNDLFIVQFGWDRSLEKTLHRGFLISWQYRMLRDFILNGQVYEAVQKDDDNK